MDKREFVMLAHDYNPSKHNVNGWFASEKLDGQRCLWLPETCGVAIANVPFANRGPRSRDRTATGLWTRYGHAIHAPTWFLDKLPPFPLDGELHAGRGNFQDVSSYVRKLVPIESEWRSIRYHLFDAPSYEQIYRDGRIYTPHYKMVYSGFLPANLPSTPSFSGKSFDVVLEGLLRVPFDSLVVAVHEQTRLPFISGACDRSVETLFVEVLESGGEGLIFRKYSSSWEPIRSHSMVKMKPTSDSEATVIGFRMGIGKYEGMMGNLEVRWTNPNGKVVEFGLSGFTDTERTLLPEYKQYAPGERFLLIPSTKFSPFFRYDDTITFSYRELTDEGKPKEARYLRPRLKGE